MSHLVSLPPLTEAQEELLFDLVDSETGGLQLGGPHLRIGQGLGKKGLAEDRGKRWFEPTERGRQVAAKLREIRG
jgi:hypothetical protein